jgi:hypothetical protein
MTSELEKATAIRPNASADREWTVEIPDRWQQGRGAFGGVVVGILARAIMASEDGRTRSLRSLSAELCAPALPGPIVVRATPLRRGASTSFVEARLEQDGALVARASAALASPRAVRPAPFRPPPPPRQPWRDVEPKLVEAPIGPVFAEKYEYRSTGPAPFVAGAEPVAEGWIREKTAPSVLDEAGIAGLLDACWPTVLAVEPEPRAVATVSYTMQLLVDPRTLDPAEPLFYRGRGVAGSANFFVEMRELWSGDALVAMNQQTFAPLS